MVDSDLSTETWTVAFECDGASPIALARAAAVALRYFALKGVHPYAAARAVFVQEGEFDDCSLTDDEWRWADIWRTAEALGLREIGLPALNQPQGSMSLVFPAAVLAARMATQ